MEWGLVNQTNIIPISFSFANLEMPALQSDLPMFRIRKLWTLLWNCQENNFIFTTIVSYLNHSFIIIIIVPSLVLCMKGRRGNHRDKACGRSCNPHQPASVQYHCHSTLGGQSLLESYYWKGQYCLNPALCDFRVISSSVSTWVISFIASPYLTFSHTDHPSFPHSILISVKESWKYIK